MRAPRSWSHIVLIFRYFQCLHLMYCEVAWVLVSLETQFQPQITLEPGYLPDYPSVSYDYGNSHKYHVHFSKTSLSKEKST